MSGKRKNRIDTELGKQIISTVAVILERERERRGMLQAAFIKHLGISLPMYHSLLRGEANPTVHMLVRIAEKLEMPLGELMFGYRGKDLENPE